MANSDKGKFTLEQALLLATSVFPQHTCAASVSISHIIAMLGSVSPFPSDKFLESSKLKEYEDDNFEFESSPKG